MGFKISNLFFVEEEGTAENKEKNKVVEAAKVSTPSVTQATNATQPQQYNTMSTTAVDTEITAKAKEALFKALNDANFEGYDYLEFKESLKALEKVIADEPTRYKSAFAAVSTLGVTNQKLLDTAQKYIEILKNEEKKFLSALGTKSEIDVTGAEKKILQIGEDIKKKDEEIARIIAEKQKMEQEKIDIANSIAETKAKIENSKNGFYSAFNEITGNIVTDINKMTNYLK